MPLKSATTSTTRANPAKGCNVTCPVAGEITIRQPQVAFVPIVVGLSLDAVPNPDQR